MRAILVIAASLAVLAFVVGLTFGRPVQAFDYDTMYTGAELVVIASPTASKDLDESTTLPGVSAGNKPIAVTGLETTFEVSVLLKGAVATGPGAKTTIVLHHYRLVDSKLAEAVNAVMLVTFKPGDRSQYLMFLKGGDSGRYEPFNGQTDPQFSIEKLRMPKSGN